MLFGAFLLALCFYVARTWLRWLRAETKLVPPKWRSGVTTFGFSACTVSLTTILFFMVYATVSSSLTPYPSHLATGLSHHLRDFAVGDSRRCRRKRPAGDAHFRLLSPVPFGSRRCGVRIVSLAQGSISAMAMFQQQPAQLTQLTIVIDN